MLAIEACISTSISTNASSNGTQVGWTSSVFPCLDMEATEKSQLDVSSCSVVKIDTVITLACLSSVCEALFFLAKFQPFVYHEH